MLELVTGALELLRDGKPARLMQRKAEQESLFRQLGLLTSKPVLYVCNVEVGSAKDGNLRVFAARRCARPRKRAPGLPS